ncbi:MAG: NmrA family NAD(P)-binding protein [Myxococcota bacterium]|nr:NmrA family NAD(P)-binding protein [Myxococcota bacterium]
MTFAIAGTSGRTGKIIADSLLAAGKKVRVIVRDAAKGEEWKRRGAEVAVADLTDAKALARALEGASGAYLLVPPAFTDDYRRQQDETSKALAAALATSRVPHVVLLSSIGAQHASGTGPIAGLHATENLFAKIPGTVFTFLRAAYFVENIGASLGAVREAGVLPSFFPADLRFPMTNTTDIGKQAARLLLEPPAKSSIVELGTDRSFAELATTLARITGKQVTVQEAPLSVMVETLTGFGFPRGLAELYHEMTGAIRTGHVRFDGHKRVEDGEPLERTLKQLLG